MSPPAPAGAIKLLREGWIAEQPEQYQHMGKSALRGRRQQPSSGGASLGFDKIANWADLVPTRSYCQDPVQGADLSALSGIDIETPPSHDRWSLHDADTTELSSAVEQAVRSSTWLQERVGVSLPLVCPSENVCVCLCLSV